MSLTLWEKDNTIVVDDQEHPILCATCPCSPCQIIGGIYHQIGSTGQYIGCGETVVCTMPYRILSGSFITIDFFGRHTIQLHAQNLDNTIFTEIFTVNQSQYELRLYQLSKKYYDYYQFKQRFFCTETPLFDIWRIVEGQQVLTYEANVQLGNKWVPEMVGRTAKWDLMFFKGICYYRVLNHPQWYPDPQTGQGQYGEGVLELLESNFEIDCDTGSVGYQSSVEQAVANWNNQFAIGTNQLIMGYPAGNGTDKNGIQYLNNKLHTCTEQYAPYTPADWYYTSELIQQNCYPLNHSVGATRWYSSVCPNWLRYQGGWVNTAAKFPEGRCLFGDLPDVTEHTPVGVKYHYWKHSIAYDKFASGGIQGVQFWNKWMFTWPNPIQEEPVCNHFDIPLITLSDTECYTYYWDLSGHHGTSWVNFPESVPGADLSMSIRLDSYIF